MSIMLKHPLGRGTVQHPNTNSFGFIVWHWNRNMCRAICIYGLIWSLGTVKPGKKPKNHSTYFTPSRTKVSLMWTVLKMNTTNKSFWKKYNNLAKHPVNCLRNHTHRKGHLPCCPPLIKKSRIATTLPTMPPLRRTIQTWKNQWPTMLVYRVHWLFLDFTHRLFD